MQDHQPEPPDAFARSRQLLESIITDLESAPTAQLTHAQIEDKITTRGRALQRALYQDHLDLRALREVDHHDVIGADGTQRTRTETGHDRTLATVFGQVSVWRKLPCARGHQLVPGRRRLEPHGGGLRPSSHEACHR